MPLNHYFQESHRQKAISETRKVALLSGGGGDRTRVPSVATNCLARGLRKLRIHWECPTGGECPYLAGADATLQPLILEWHAVPNEVCTAIQLLLKATLKQDASN